MVEVLERALDPRVAPARIVGRHPDDQASDYTITQVGLRCLAEVHFRAISSRCHRRMGLASRASRPSQHAAFESQPQHRESSALIVDQPESPAAQLRLERAILFAEKGDYIALLPLEPSKQRR